MASKQAKRPKTKQCIGEACGGKRQPTENFPRSARAKDGRLGFCKLCWSEKMKAARWGHKNGKSKPNGTPPQNGANGHSVDAVNQALEKANGMRERFMVEADDGDTKEFRSEPKAIKQAIAWRLDGYSVRVWRECEFIFDARIVG